MASQVDANMRDDGEQSFERRCGLGPPIEFVDRCDDARFRERIDGENDVVVCADFGRDEHNQGVRIGRVEDVIEELTSGAANVGRKAGAEYVEAAAEIAASEWISFVAGWPKAQLVSDG
jgi:hypothetical protein